MILMGFDFIFSLQPKRLVRSLLFFLECPIRFNLIHLQVGGAPVCLSLSPQQTPAPVSQPLLITSATGACNPITAIRKSNVSESMLGGPVSLAQGPVLL